MSNPANFIRQTGFFLALTGSGRLPFACSRRRACACVPPRPNPSNHEEK
jgi:hypothetical protein